MIPIILDNTMPLSYLVEDTSGGIGELAEAYDGVAIEEANGIKEIQFKVPVGSPHYDDLELGCYLKVKADEFHDYQIYEVYKITRPISQKVTVYAQHISYLLNKASVLPCSAEGASNALNALKDNLVGTYPFDVYTNLTNVTSRFNMTTPMSFRGAIGGWQGSILSVFGGQLDWDNLTVKLLRNRGADRGVSIEYGKNLTDLRQDESIASMYNAVLGYAVVDEVTTVGEMYKIVQTDSPKAMIVDFSERFSADNPPTVQALTQLAQQYAESNNIGVPKINIKVSFIPLSKTEDYKNIKALEKVGLFDTVNVSFPKLRVSATAKVIRTEYDFINEKIVSIELGDAKTNLTGLISGQVNSEVGSIASEQKKTNSFIESYATALTNVIANSMGLFVSEEQREGGGTQIFLHNRPVLQESRYQWTITEGALVASDDYGNTWLAGIDSEGDAVFNSLAANAIKSMIINGSAINNSVINGSEIFSSNMHWFDGTGSEAMLESRYYEGTNSYGIAFEASDRLDIKSESLNLEGSSTYQNIECKNTISMSNQMNYIGKDVTNDKEIVSVSANPTASSPSMSATLKYNNGNSTAQIALNPDGSIYIKTGANIYFEGNEVYFNNTKKW